ncbi:MAG: twin-arginine translocation signal domain-containing protein [Hyphomicrobiales bacterium]|nr:twin-arginine translocation signal domain-containing protein [Hyphomicrobiales bacterium]MBV9907128.1 twin-arginine translocation signal domain-containing protein [Hyphomicrobiales bacterium]
MLRRTDERLDGSLKGCIDRRQFLGAAGVTAFAGAGLQPQRAAAHDAFSGYDGIGFSALAIAM